MEHRVCAGQGIGDAGGREATHHQGQQRGHGEVNHQHFKRKHQAGNGSFEDTGNSSRSTASDEQHHGFVFQAKGFAETRTDGRTRQHDGRLGSHASAETDGQGRSHHTGPAIVPTNVALSARDGVKNLRNTVADIVAHQITDEQGREHDAHNRINKKESVGLRNVKTVRQQELYFMDEPFQRLCCDGGSHSHGKAEHQQELARAGVALHPCPEAQPGSGLFFCIFHIGS